MKKDEKEIKEFREYQIGLKNGKFIPISGYEKKQPDSADDMIFLDIDGRMHSINKAAIGCIISDVPETADYTALKKQKVVGCRMYLESGGMLNFNGWKIPNSEGIYLSEQDDLIIIKDKIIYESVGDVEKEPEPKPAPLKAVKAEGK